MVQRANDAASNAMDPESRLSPVQHRHLAARYRALAAEATTARAREYLLAMAEQCDALAEGGIDLAAPTFGDAADKRARPSPSR